MFNFHTPPTKPGGEWKMTHFFLSVFSMDYLSFVHDDGPEDKNHHVGLVRPLPNDPFSSVYIGDDLFMDVLKVLIHLPVSL